jgi:6,7-dimethyl-8-ribityllumazine synthase
VALDAGVPVANGVLTTENDAQARARVAEKGRDAARVAVEMANLVWALEESGEGAAGESDPTAVDVAAR